MARMTVGCIGREAEGQAVVAFPFEVARTTADAREHKSPPNNADSPSHGVVEMERGSHGFPRCPFSRTSFELDVFSKEPKVGAIRDVLCSAMSSKACSSMAWKDSVVGVVGDELRCAIAS